MRRCAATLALSALLAPLAAYAETYTKIHEIWIDPRFQASGIATTNSDSFQIRSRYGEVESYDSFYLSGGTIDLAYTGDGLVLPSSATQASYALDRHLRHRLHALLLHLGCVQQRWRGVRLPQVRLRTDAGSGVRS